LNKALFTAKNPLADVFFGVDNTFLSRALQNQLFERYDAPALAHIPTEFQLDGGNTALPVDYGDVCINYDKAYFQQAGLPLPASLVDLTKPEYKGLLVVENPATSSPGMAFLLATIAAYGPEDYLGYWKDLRVNDVQVVNDWETAYYTNFSASSGRGPQPMVVSYGTSPAAEVVYAAQPLTESPTASLVGDNMCFRQVEFVGILKGTTQRVLAEQFVDFMLSQPVQEDIPLQMFMFPVLSTASIPEVFTQNVQVPEHPAVVDPAQVELHREQWLQDWAQAMFE
jgi:thiamine transport system substrate-binding protein